MAEAPASDNAALTADFLKQHDRDRYLASLVLPEVARGPIQALYAFSADVAAVRERISEPAPGEIRLQWWDDALTGKGHGKVRSNPVADTLLSAIGEYGLPVVPLQRLIAARRFDLYDDPMPDLESFEGYAGETVSTLYQYAAMVLNHGVPVETGDAAGHLGVAQAMLGHVRAFGYNAAKGRLFLPLPLLAAHGVGERAIFSGTDTPQLRAALSQVGEMAGEHLAQAETAIAALPKALRPAFAMLAVLKLEHRRLPKIIAHPFAKPEPLADYRKLFALSVWSWRNG